MSSSMHGLVQYEGGNVFMFIEDVEDGPAHAASAANATASSSASTASFEMLEYRLPPRRECCTCTILYNGWRVSTI